MTRIARFELVVSDLERLAAFYTEALGFTRGAAGPVDPALYGVDRVDQLLLSRGEQVVALQAMQPAGAPYPAGVRGCDGAFQHFALPVADIGVAYARLERVGAAAISMGGPQQLPAASGGAVAYKFRDPDGHPLELIQFPDRREGGVDHSAVASLDVARSIAFYQDECGLALRQRQVNTGPEQDRLDGLAGVAVDVVALAPAVATPHVELLAYRTPRGHPAAAHRPNDIAATRIVFAAEGSGRRMVRDPDGHLLVLEGDA